MKLIKKNKHVKKNNGPTFGAGLMVKNEEHCIKRCIESWKDEFDYFVIVDTGSDDNTLKIIKELLKDYPGEIYQDEWVKEGINRNRVCDRLNELEFLDYLVGVDADDEFLFKDNWKEEISSTNHDMYNIIMMSERGTQTIPKIRTRACTFRFDDRFSVHCLYGPTTPQTNTNGLLKKVSFIHHQDGASHKQPTKEKYLKYAEMIKADIAEHGDIPRMYFYLGDSLMLAGEYDEAKKAFEKRIALKGWDEEVYYSMLNIARINRDPLYYRATIEHSPNRPEGYIELIYLYRDRGELNRAYDWLKRAKMLTVSNDFRLFYNPLLITETIPRLEYELDKGLFLGHG
tara:strand:+ start:919 stop:1947 length:1029 start_codon:yes stop_codon:yes gene_type:complete